MGEQLEFFNCSRRKKKGCVLSLGISALHWTGFSNNVAQEGGNWFWGMGVAESQGNTFGK